MLNNTLTQLFDTRYRVIWLLLIGLCLAMEVIALYYQYQLNEPPCVVCIHVRILLASLILLLGSGYVIRQFLLARVVVLVALLVNSAALIERSLELLGVERGLIMGSCSFNLGLPTWLALDQWFPFIFKVHSSCGYTPELLFGITMAEGLLVLSSLAVVLFLLLIWTAIFNKPR